LFPNLNQHVGPTRPLSLAGTTLLSRDGRSHPSRGVLSPFAAARGDVLLDVAALALSWMVHQWRSYTENGAAAANPQTVVKKFTSD
jgi:hypothetical protein